MHTQQQLPLGPIRGPFKSEDIPAMAANNLMLKSLVPELLIPLEKVAIGSLAQ